MKATPRAFRMNPTQDGTTYRFVGPEGAPFLVLIHGLGLNHHMWDEHLDALTSQYRILTYDLSGHGESALPTSKLSLKMFSQQLFQLLNALEIQHCGLIGFSLGGMINRRFVMDYPSIVTALGIFNSPHERKPEEQKLVEDRAEQSSVGGLEATLDATIERWFTPAFRTQKPEVIQQVRDWVLANNPDVFAQTRYVLAHGVKELIRPKPPIDVPALIMTCENDAGSTPTMSRAIASEIEGARALIVPQLQHMGLLEKPNLFTKPLLQFLRTVPT